MSTTAIDMMREVNSLIIMFMFFYLQTRVLPMSRRGLYLVCMMAIEVFYGVLTSTGFVQWGASPSSPLWWVYILLEYLLMPFAFWEAKLARKAIAAALCVLVLIGSEIVLALIWPLATGEALADANAVYQAPIVYLGTQLVEASLLALAGIFLAPRFCAWAAGAEQYGAVSVQERIAWFVPVQALMLILMLTCMYSQFFSEPLYLWVFLAVALFNFGADAVVLLAMTRARKQAAAAARAQALECALKDCLASYEKLVDTTAATARVRHDARNHAQVVAQLIDDGELDRARAYVDQLPEPGGVTA